MIDLKIFLFNPIRCYQKNQFSYLLKNRLIGGRSTFHLKNWNTLIPNGIETHMVDSHHLTLFKESEVQGLAATIGKQLSELKN